MREQKWKVLCVSVRSGSGKQKAGDVIKERRVKRNSTEGLVMKQRRKMMQLMWRRKTALIKDNSSLSARLEDVLGSDAGTIQWPWKTFLFVFNSGVVQRVFKEQHWGESESSSNTGSWSANGWSEVGGVGLYCNEFVCTGFQNYFQIFVSLFFLSTH